MGASRFICTLEPACSSYARVTITDTEGETARACSHHAVAALNGITGGRVIWDDMRGINNHERTALHLAEERSQLCQTVPGHPEPPGRPRAASGHGRACPVISG